MSTTCSFRDTRERISRFVQRQIKELRARGWPLLFRRSRTLFLMALTLPIVLLVRLLRPLVVIRFGCLRSDRMGHFIGNTEMYLREYDAGMHQPRILDIFYHQLPICNYQLKKMWERTERLLISPFNNFTRALDMLSRLLPGGERHAIVTSDKDIYSLYTHIKPHLSFTSEEEHLGQAALRKLGISNGAPFVCFLARTSTYLDTMFPSKNWCYHAYRDSSIKNFIPAAEELVSRDYFAIRMGAIVEESLETSNPMIIDYATESRTEFLDIFLGAKCRFYLGDSCGFHAIPMIFGRPLVIVNMIPLKCAPTWGPTYLFIPKKLWLRKERRFMTFREILDSKVKDFYDTEQYEQFGIEVVENTPKEITTLAIEMDEQLNGRRQTTEDDEELQQCFQALFKRYNPDQVFLSRIGAEFLRQNQELLV